MTDGDARALLARKTGLSAAGAAAAIRYLRLLEKWNRVHNLSGAKTFAEMMAIHPLDSLALSPFMPAAGAVADIGSGAGFPAAALAAAHPALRLVAVEAREKKAAFIRHAAAESGLGNLAATHARAEKWRSQTPRAALVARGVASIAKVIKISEHLFGRRQSVLLLKPRCPQAELDAARGAHRQKDIRARIVQIAAPVGPSRYIVAMDIR